MAEELTREEEILAIAADMAKTTPSEADTLARLCAAAREDLKRRLRPELSEEDCGGAFVCAAAWLAAAAMESTRSGEELSSLRAGDMQIVPRTERERRERYERLRRQAWDLMSPYIRDSAFCFCGVRG